MQIALRNRQRSVPIKGPQIKKTLLRISRTKEFQQLLPKGLDTGAQPPSFEVSILLVGDQTIRKMNRQFRAKDKVTDVLSFPIYDFTVESVNRGVSPVLLGDIVISVPQAKRQAEAMGLSTEEEVLRLAIHGLLHLLGYDHETSKKDAQKMKSLERRLLRCIKGQ